MDVELARSLEQLETQKRLVNGEVDLTHECESIVELSNRISLLLDEVKSLRNNLAEESAIISANCDKLEPSYSNLVRTSQVFDLSSKLTKLNRVCRRIDSSRLCKSILDPGTGHQQLESISNQPNGGRPSLVRNNGDEVNEYDADDDELQPAQVIHELVEQFEEAYQPLEALLFRRQDLPYGLYANKVKDLKASVISNNVPNSQLDS